MKIYLFLLVIFHLLSLFNITYGILFSLPLMKEFSDLHAFHVIIIIMGQPILKIEP